MPAVVTSKIKSNKEIADKIYEMVIEGDFPQREFSPGVFLHIKCSSGYDPLLRRPISICDVRDNQRELVLLYRAEGKGTSLLAEQVSGNEIDMLAPLGQGFNLDAIKPGDTALLIGGGIGVPPLYYLGRKLKERGVNIKSVIGFNQAKDVFYADAFAELGETWVTTIGEPPASSTVKSHQGLVTDVLSKIGDWQTLYSCGPTAMLKALQKVIDKNKTAFISLEERMGCGVGACLACVCDLAEPQPGSKNYVRVCTEGPVFALNQVVL